MMNYKNILLIWLFVSFWIFFSTIYFLDSPMGAIAMGGIVHFMVITSYLIAKADDD